MAFRTSRWIFSLGFLVVAAFIPMRAYALYPEVNGTIEAKIVASLSSETETELGKNGVSASCGLLASSTEAVSFESVSVNSVISDHKLICHPILNYSFFYKNASTEIVISYSITIFGGLGDRTSQETVAVIPIPPAGAVSSFVVHPAI